MLEIPLSKQKTMKPALHALFLQAAPGPEQPNALMSLLPLVLMFVAFYFFIIAPQRKQQKAVAKFQSELKVGDSVMTSAGIFGKVVSIAADENKVTLQVAEGVRLVFLRTAVLPADQASN